MRESFVIMTEHHELVNDLTDEQAGVVFKALFASQLGEKADIGDQAARIVYKAILSQVNRTHASYDKRVAKGKQAADRRWSDTKPMPSDTKPMLNDAKQCQTMPSDAKAYNPVPVPDLKETLTKVSVKKSGFTPPTLQEVQEYASEKGLNIDCEHFIDFYASKGWMVGKNKMKDWKASVRNWARSQRQEETANGKQEMTAERPEKTVNRFNNFQQRNYDFDELERRLTGRVT